MLARLRPSDIRPTIREKDVTWLGRIGGYDYAEHKGVEYLVTTRPIDPQAFAREPGEAMIVKRVRELFDGSPVERDDHFRATIVPNGTYAALLAKQAAARAKGARKAIPRPIDLLAAHPLLRRRSAELLRFVEEADPLIGQFSERVRGIILAGREAQQGPAAVVATLREKGIQLTLTADGSAIVPIATDGRASDSVRSLIELAAPLLVPFLAGRPLTCQLKHSEKQPPEAESLLVGGAAACAAHLAGELAP